MDRNCNNLRCFYSKTLGGFYIYFARPVIDIAQKMSEVVLHPMSFIPLMADE